MNCSTLYINNITWHFRWLFMKHISNLKYLWKIPKRYTPFKRVNKIDQITQWFKWNKPSKQVLVICHKALLITLFAKSIMSCILKVVLHEIPEFYKAFIRPNKIDQIVQCFKCKKPLICLYLGKYFCHVNVCVSFLWKMVLSVKRIQKVGRQSTFRKLL